MRTRRSSQVVSQQRCTVLHVAYLIFLQSSKNINFCRRSNFSISKHKKLPIRVDSLVADFPFPAERRQPVASLLQFYESFYDRGRSIAATSRRWWKRAVSLGPGDESMKLKQNKGRRTLTRSLAPDMSNDESRLSRRRSRFWSMRRTRDTFRIKVSRPSRISVEAVGYFRPTEGKVGR